MTVPDDQRQVLGKAAEHRSDEVGAERCGSRGGIAESLGEDEVGEEDRRERQRGGDHQARHERQVEQHSTGHQPVDGQSAEQGDVEQAGPPDAHPFAQRHGQQHGHQHPAEDKGVDEPCRPEQQGELHNALRLQQQECGAHAQQIEVGRHRPQGTARHAYDDQGKAEDEGDGNHVEPWDARRSQVGKRMVVRGGGGCGGARVERLADRALERRGIGADDEH